MRFDIQYLKKEDNIFPNGLKSLDDCPDIIYAVGNTKLLNEFSLAIVGARRCTLDGKRIANKIADELASNGINIVSGLAYGIDSEAHKATIWKEGKPIAVLGFGFDYLPKVDRENLYEEIINCGGVIVSEYLENDPPNKIKFHKRNRIISALAKGVLVIEAREKSGSLITIDYAKQLDKDVFVVPGGVFDENYIGSNKLIADGGKCVRNAEDILKFYSLINCSEENNVECKKSSKIQPELLKVYKVLSKRGKSIDEICSKIDMPASNVMSSLTLLTIQGHIVQYPGNIFAQK